MSYICTVVIIASILTDLYLTSRVPDIVFCPISISYERVLEEKLLARELLGIPKPKETFTVGAVKF